MPAFMEQAIRVNLFVLIICTPRYKARSEARRGGVGYEGDIMTAEVLNQGNHRKFIPVLRSGTWDEAAPPWLKGKFHIDLPGDPYSEEQYALLVRTLLGIRETAPPIGKAMSTISSTAKAQIQSRSEGPGSGYEDIKVTGIVVESITAPRNDGTRGSALYTVPFSLSHRPDPEWSRLFTRNWDRPPRFTTMHRPGIARIRDAVVVLEGTTIEEVERSHRDTLLLAVDETNRQFRELRDERKRLQAQEEASREEHQRHVEDIASQIDFEGS